MHQTYIGRLHKAEQQPSLDEVHAAMRVFKIDPGFFFDPGLGSDPDYRDHRAGAQETRVDRTEGAVQALETLIAERAEMGRPVSPTVAERARRAARSAGIETRGEASLLVETLELVEAPSRAERAGRRSAWAEPPMPHSTIACVFSRHPCRTACFRSCRAA